MSLGSASGLRVPSSSGRSGSVVAQPAALTALARTGARREVTVTQRSGPRRLCRDFGAWQCGALAGKCFGGTNNLGDGARTWET